MARQCCQIVMPASEPCCVAVEASGNASEMLDLRLCETAFEEYAVKSLCEGMLVTSWYGAQQLLRKKNREPQLGVHARNIQ